MPVNVLANLMLQGARGLTAAPQAYREEGASGVAQALMDPRPYERSARENKLKEQFGPELTAIDEAVSQGDDRTGMAMIASLYTRMDKAGARGEAIREVLGPRTVALRENAMAQANLESPSGQNTALRVAGASNPAAGAQIAEVGAELPTRRMGPQVTQANINQTIQETARAKETTENLIPAQADYYRANTQLSGARAGAYDRGDFARRGNTVQDMFTKGAGVMARFDTPLFKAVADPMTSSNPAAIQGQLDQRNFMARSLGMPELEMVQTIDPTADPALPLEQRQTFSLRMKQVAQQPGQGQPGQQPQQQEQPPALLPMGSGTGPTTTQSEPTNPMATMPAAPQRQPIQAAVQNPMGALPEDVQFMLKDPRFVGQTEINASLFQQQGYTPQESEILMQALMQQVAGGGQTMSPHPSPSPSPWATPTMPLGQRQPTPRPY